MNCLNAFLLMCILIYTLINQGIHIMLTISSRLHEVLHLVVGNRQEKLE